MQRHERCEMEERKRFMAYVKNAHTGRPRAHRRTDSRAGSSGANTPGSLSFFNPYWEGTENIFKTLVLTKLFCSLLQIPCLQTHLQTWVKVLLQ